jgi:hypothetical protein
MRKLLVALGGLFLCLAANAQNGAVGSLTAQGADCTTAGACISLQFDINDVASASIQLSGTFTATVQFEASSDKGTTWVAIAGTPLNSSTAATSATTANTWKFNVASITNIRARCSAWTSAPTVVIRSSRAVANAIGGGGAVYASGNGTNNVIPKGNGANQLADSSITDNATNVATAEPLNLTAASSTTNAIVQFNSVATTGLMFGASTQVGLKVNSTNWLATDSNQNMGLQVPSTSSIGWSSVTTYGGGVNDAVLRRVTTASVGQGGANSATPAAQTFTLGESSRGGTDSNVAGASGTLKPGIGTGLGAGTKLCIQRDIMGATGSVAQSTIDGYCVGPSKTLSNTSATAQSLVNISVPSNSAGGVFGTITVTCTDGTNFDSETQSFNTSFVNKATVLTVTAPVITATTAANNSGSCTAGITAVAGTNSVDIKVTPVFTTIVPTIVTSYIEIANHGTGNATFN